MVIYTLIYKYMYFLIGEYIRFVTKSTLIVRFDSLDADFLNIKNNLN